MNDRPADKQTEGQTDGRTDRPSVLRETDEEARRLARILVRGARQMALAVIDPDTGFPSVSRALATTDLDGTPVTLASALSAHTKGLLADDRCSLLAGEPGKGDPLAHPRMTLQCRAVPVDRNGDLHQRLRERFLDRHPKAALYIDFPDFRFFRLVPQVASLNGGFGRAYALPGSDLILSDSLEVMKWRDLQARLRGMPEAAAQIAARLSSAKSAKWRFGGVDPSGFDLIGGDIQLRQEFEAPISSPETAFDHISRMADSIGTSAVSP
nr:pyridoxamine 5'-phosphate oxidase [Rhizobium sp. Q54]